MKRLFGKKKEVAPPPTLDDATGSLEKRGDGVDAKIKKLDLELARHREERLQRGLVVVVGRTEHHTLEPKPTSDAVPELVRLLREEANAL